MTLKQRQTDTQKALGLGSTYAAQDKDTLSPELEKFIERGDELRKDMIVVDKGDKVI